jgi:hypothetical protein
MVNKTVYVIAIELDGEFWVTNFRPLGSQDLAEGKIKYLQEQDKEFSTPTNYKIVKYNLSEE